MVVPSISILAEPPVSVVDKVAAKHGTGEIAKAYLEYLYSDEGQEIAARNFYRPRNPKIAAKYARTSSPKLPSSPSTIPSAAGPKLRKSILTMAAYSTKSTLPEPDKMSAPFRKHSILPGVSGPRSAIPRCT